MGPGGPYGGGPFPSAPFPGGYPQPPKSHTTRNVLLTLLVVVIVVCGGGIGTSVVLIRHAVDKQNAKRHYAGNPDDPITVKLGARFTIRDYSYAKGWSLASDVDVPASTIGGLSVTDHGDADSVSIEFSFLRGSSIVAQVECYSGGSTIGHGQTKALDCYNSSDKPIERYDKITVADSFNRED